MKVDVRTIVRHMSGAPLKTTPDERDDQGNVIKEGEPMILGDVLVQAALQPSMPNKSYTPRQQIIRYTLAYDAWKAKENDEDPTMHVSHRAVMEIADDISRIYTPVAGGQILLLLGYRIEDEDDDADPRQGQQERMPDEMRRKLRPLAPAQK